MRQMKTWLLTLALLLGSITANAYDFEVDGICYNVTSSTDLTVEVTERYFRGYRDSVYVIPAKVTSDGITYSVTSIGEDAFYGCSSLTSITIPEGVTSIGETAFSGCSGLTSIILPEGVTCIGDHAFNYCSGLTSITLPEGLKSIEDYAFYTCSGLTSITLPEGVTSIGSFAFFDCTGLTSITLPESLTKIGSSVFSGCTGLTSITLPEGVTSIGSFAFYKCTGLTSITLSESLTSIGDSAFYGCSGLRVVINHSNLNIEKDSPEQGYVVINNIDGYAGDFVFEKINDIYYLSAYLGNDSVLTLPEKYKDKEYAIKEYAFNFRGYQTLTSITLPEGVTSIGEKAFSGCSGLTSITLPESVRYIGERAFSYSGLTSIDIPKGVTSIGEDAFYGCSGLTSIMVAEDNPVYDSRNNCNAIIKTSTNHLLLGCNNTTIPESVTSIGSYAFQDCSGLTSITLPESVRYIRERAFSYSGLTSIDIPKGVTSIGSYAFLGCSGLTSIMVAEDNPVYDSRNNCNAIIKTSTNNLLLGCNNTTIPESVTSIGDYAFNNCSGLTSITLPEGVTRIGYRAFAGCTGLTSITLPESVTSISNYAFFWCEKLQEITCYAYEPPTLYLGAFEYIAEDAVLYVYPAAIPFYTEAEGWKDFTIRPFSEDGLALDVNLPAGSEDGRYKNMIVELIDTETGETRHLSVTNRLTYSFSGLKEGRSYNLYLKNKLGDILGSIEGVVVTEAEATVSFEILNLPQTVSLNVLLPHGQDITEETTISWFDKGKNYISQGRNLNGLVQGSSIIYNVKLPRVLAEQYQQPTDSLYTVKESDNNIVCTLNPYRKVKVSSRVLEQNSNNVISGVTVNIEQTIGDGIKKTTTEVSDNNGCFTAEIYNVPANIFVSSPQYLTKDFTLQALAGDEQLDDIMLEPVQGTAIIFDFTYTGSVYEGQNVVTDNRYYDEKNVVFTIYNKSKETLINRFCVQNSGIILQEKVEENDVLQITAKSKTEKFKDVVVEGVVNALGQLKVTIPVVELGALNAYCMESNEHKAVGLLYDSEGLLVRKEYYTADSLTIKNIPDGQYTLVSMSDSEFFTSLPTLSEYGHIGLTENVDFVKREITIASGRISSVQVNNIPLLDESKFYYTATGTEIVANKPSATVGDYIVLKANVDFKDEYADDVDGLKLMIHLPDGCELYPNTVLANGKMANYTKDDNRVEVRLDDVKSNIRMCVIPNKPGVKKPSGFLQFDINGKNVVQPIGAAYFACKSLELSVPVLTNDSCITVRGVALRKKTDVYIYDNTKLIGQTTSQADGNWNAEVKLYKPYTHTYHRIYAVVKDELGNEFQTETKVVEYDKGLSAVLENIIMIYNGQQITLDQQTGERSANNYSYVPGNGDFTFTASFSSNDSIHFQNLLFKVLASDGSVRTLPATYSARQNLWLATSTYPDSNKIPINVAVEYDNTGQMSPIFDDEMKADFNRITQTIFNEIENAYMNAPIEIIEHKDSCLYFSVITNGYNTKEYYKLFVLDYEETVQEYKDKDLSTVQNDTTDLCCVYELVNDNAHFVVWDNTNKEAYHLIHSGQRPLENSDRNRILPFFLGAMSNVAMSAFEYELCFSEIDSWYNTVNEQTDKFRYCVENMHNILYATCDDGTLRIKDPQKFAYCKKLADQWTVSYNRYLDEFKQLIEEDKRTLQQRVSLKAMAGIMSGTASNMLGKLIKLSGFKKIIIDLYLDIVSEIYSNIIGDEIDNIDETLRRDGVRTVISDWYLINSQKNMDAYAELIHTIKSNYSSCEEEQNEETETGEGSDTGTDFLTPDLTPAIDPSGYVYESVPSNRLQGVTATIFYQESSEDIYGNTTNETVLWNAEEFSQKNPLITDAEGKYQWDVPQGLWQVKYEKEGYETTYSDWLPVPPPQLEVNIAMTQNRQPEVKAVRAYEDGVEVEFDKYMQLDGLTTKNIFVTKNGETAAGTVKLLNEEKAYEDNPVTYASKVRFVPETAFLTTDEVVLTVSRNVKSYAGVPMATDYTQAFDIEKEVKSIVADSIVRVAYNGEKEITVSALPYDAAIGKKLVVKNSSSMIASVSADTLTLDENGQATLTLNGELPGTSMLTFTLAETDVQALSAIQVVAPEFLTTAAPKASRASGTAVYRGTAVRLTCETKDAVIYYTLDGSCPCDENAPRMVYEYPIIITDDTTIKAMAAVAGQEESGVAEFSFTIKRANLGMELKDGWNWVSHNMESEMSTVILPQNASRIVGQTAELMNDPVLGLVGNLKTLQPSEAYKIQMPEDSIHVMSGYEFNPATPISLKQGWNWLGYPVSQTMSLNEAFANAEPNEGDYIVGQDGFAQYADNTWTGTLMTLVPGKGYLYQSMRDNSFVYNTALVSKARSLYRTAGRNRAPWHADKYKYPNIMCLVAEIYENGQTSQDYSIGAFCGTECRGVGKYVDGKLMMNIYGEGNEKIEFRAVHNETQESFDITEGIAFKETLIGSLSQPYALHIGEATGVTEIQSGWKVWLEGSDLYLALNGKLFDSVTLTDAYGTVYLSIESVSENEPVNIPELPAGVYIVTATQGKDVYNKKILKK